LFGYDGSWPEGDTEKHKGEVEIEDMISLLDLLLLCEIVAFALLANDISSQTESSSDMPLAINYSERLIAKLDDLTLSEKLHKDNKKVASNL
jgi:hypothetical protein